jgi:tetratricopeptide (TPR) repeat protein
VRLSALFALGCGALEPPVLRSVDGVTTEGRFIEADAYALYAVAAMQETKGQLPEALELYQRALGLDHRSPELRTRIGAVACKLRQKRISDRAFSTALELDREYGPAWFELALCRKARGDLPGALSAALQAVELDPERYEASLLAADLEELRGDRANAWRFRDALATHAPDSLLVQRALLRAAGRAGEAGRAARAQRRISELTQGAETLTTADGTELAVAALARGDVDAARQLAERALGADPSNGDALLLALTCADLAQDPARFARLLGHADSMGTPISERLRSLLEALLARRVGVRAAELVRARP